MFTIMKFSTISSQYTYLHSILCVFSKKYWRLAAKHKYTYSNNFLPNPPGSVFGMITFFLFLLNIIFIRILDIEICYKNITCSNKLVLFSSEDDGNFSQV